MSDPTATSDTARPRSHRAPTPYYEDESVTLYLGDCRQIVPALGQTFDLVLTDPPYGDTSLSWDRWPDGWLTDIDLTELTRQVWCFGSFRMFLDHGREFTAQGWNLGQEIIWEKHNGSSFHADRFKRVHELAVHWYRGKWSTLGVHPQYVAEATARTVRRKTRPAHTGHIEASSYRSEDGGPKLQRSVIYCRSMHGSAIHPTEKPHGILEPLIRYSTNSGDVILDPFGGSCSTARTARLLGRRAVCIEADESYLAAAVAALGQHPLALT